MSKEISNFQIEQTIKNLIDDDIMKNFVGVFPAIHTNKLIDSKSMISGKTSFFDCKHRQLRQGRYTLVKHTWHWIKTWSFFFFWFFWNWRAKKFYDTERWKGYTKNIIWNWKMTRSDNKITLVNIKFSMKTLYLKRFSFILFSHLQISSNSTSL